MTFEYAGNEVNLQYLPGLITEVTFAQLLAFGKLDKTNLIQQFTDFNATLCHIVKSWDVYEDDDKTTVFPLEAKRIAELPFAFRIAVLNAIMRDIRPNDMIPTS